MTEHIKQLEQDVKGQRQRKEEERISFADQMKSGTQNKDDLHAEYE